MVFHIWSDSFKDGDLMPQAQVYNGMGQKGQNLSPSLRWSGAPKGTKSFVITIFDPDAPTGSGWWHWVVVNIPPDVDLFQKVPLLKMNFLKVQFRLKMILVNIITVVRHHRQD